MNLRKVAVALAAAVAILGLSASPTNATATTREAERFCKSPGAAPFRLEAATGKELMVVFQAGRIYRIANTGEGVLSWVLADGQGGRPAVVRLEGGQFVDVLVPATQSLLIQREGKEARGCYAVVP